MEWCDYLDYKDGKLIWKNVNPNPYRKNGDEAGSISSTTGYIYVCVGGVSRAAHSIIWEMHHGPIPKGMVNDHINHNRLDNRIENLRLVSIQDNNKNRGITELNTSGVVGVSWDKSRSKWFAFIKHDRKMKNLGRYECFDAAVKARKDAERKLGFHQNHGL